MFVTRRACPKCFTQFVKRVTRKGLKERLLCRLYLHLFRCQICRFRFRVFQWGVSYPAVAEDRREYERLAMNFPISFFEENIVGAGTVSDISINGCAFGTDLVLTDESIVRLALQISNELQPVDIDAAVVRNVGQGRVGVEFLRVQRAARERLQVFIGGLRRQ